eukprot:gene22127-26845_t
MVLATSATVTAAAAATLASSSSSSSSTRAGPVDVAADEHNPGNLLLRKFGWTDGQGLGKDNAGRAVAVGVELASAEYAQQTSAMQATLRSTLGPAAMGAATGAAAAAGGAALSRTQQNMAAARARFDELEQHTEKRPVGRPPAVTAARGANELTNTLQVVVHYCVAAVELVIDRVHGQRCYCCCYGYGYGYGYWHRERIRRGPVG